MRLALIIIAALALAGCKSACRQLSEQLCNCAVNSFERDACLRSSSAAEGSNPPTADDETFCLALLRPPEGTPGCDCRLLDTPEGKIRCGLARTGASSGTGNPDGGR